MGTPPAITPAGALVLHDAEFTQFQQMIRRSAGITMSPAKKALVASRLARRVQHHGLASFGAYYRLLDARPDERQIAVDLLTTNETHFFREMRHFDVLRDTVLPERRPGRALRVWSAAASSGQEAYSLAMVLAEQLGDTPWEVFGSDISQRVLEQARSARYDIAQASEIAPHHLRACCLKGVGSQHGSFVIAPDIARRVSFAQVNLNEPLPDVGDFDVIFLRNVMIYFDVPTKRAVVSRLVTRLRPRGWLFVGHSESLNGIADGLRSRAPSAWQRCD